MLSLINHLDDEKAEQLLLAELQVYYDEVRIILPSLPKNLQIYFDRFCILPQYGCGGFAYSSEIMTIGYDTEFDDKELQSKALRSTVFHESYHLAQGYHSQMGDITPIEEAVYEGAATVFERDFTGAEIPFGHYEGEAVQQWKSQIVTLPISYDRNKWKFFDDGDQASWKLYKVGTYITDQVIINTGKTVLDLNKLSAKEILMLSD